MFFRIIVSIFFMISTSCLSAEIELGINYVTSKTLNVRSSPSVNANVVGKKIFRQGVEVIEIKGEWARLYFYDKSTSHWVSVKHLSNIQPFAEASKLSDQHLINELIPRTSSERANYYLLKMIRKDASIVTIHKRVSAKSIGYSKTEIDCTDKTYRSLGYTETSAEYFFTENDKPSNWTKIVNGSSKSDLVNYICNEKQYQ